MNVRRVLAKRFRRFRANQRAATSVEYGFIISLIVLALMAALVSVAEASTELWGDVSNKVTRAE